MKWIPIWFSISLFAYEGKPYWKITTTELLVHEGEYVPGEGLPLFELRPPMFTGLEWATKRAFDLVVAARLRASSARRSGSLVAAAIKLDSRGPVLYVDRRVGVGEREFGMLKFRTMVADAAEQQPELEDENEASGALFKIRDDPRVTRVGRVLRRLSLDELPQLVNVLRGEMSLVGPRPLPLRDHAMLEEWHRARSLVLPGMTGLWQISGRSGLDVRRPRAARLRLHRELVDLVGRLDHRADDPGGAQRARRVLRPRPGAGTPSLHCLSCASRRILAVASAVDLDFRYGCTPAWWQLWKGLYEAGVDLVVTPYRGRPVESPWWRTAPNPTYREGESYAALRSGLARLKGDRYLRRAEASPEDSAFDRLTRETIWKVVTPRWRRHLDRLVARERPDAVLVFTVPMAHFRGIPTHLRERHGIPVVFYDGDVPMSLPEFGGMDTGFNYYHGADPSEYDLVLSNSEGGPRAARRARRAPGRGGASGRADPEFFRPLPVEKECDVFFYGYGDKFRREWMARARRRAEPRDPRIDFALGGRDFQGDVGLRAARRRRPVQRLRARDLRRPDQPQHDAPLARDGRRLVDVPAVRARRGRRRDRLEPARGHRALVRAGRGARRRRGRRRRARGVPRAARRPGRGGGDGRARARARARRAHLRAPRASGAAAARARVARCAV